MLMTPQYRAGFPGVPVTRLSPPNPFYVNTITGTVGGTGSISLPVNSLAIAQAVCAGIPDQVIRVTAPESNPLRQEIVNETSMNGLIESVGGEPWAIYGSDEINNAWSGSGPIYFRTLNYTLLNQVVVTSLNELVAGKSFHPKLLQNTVMPAAPAPGEFGYASGVLYVRLWDDSAASLHTFEVARRNTCISTIGFGGLTISGAIARHALVNCLHNGRATQPLGTGKLYVLDSLTEYSANGGVGAAGQNEETICTRVESYRVANDAFNHHGLTGGIYMELRGCKGGYCGDKAGQSAQGASNHESSVMVIKGGEFNYSVSGGMVVIESATCNLIGDSEYGPITMTGNMRLGNTPGPVATQAACAWLDTAKGNASGLVSVIGNGGVGVRVAPGAIVTGRENIVSSGNALPDVG